MSHDGTSVSPLSECPSAPHTPSLHQTSEGEKVMIQVEAQRVFSGDGTLELQLTFTVSLGTFPNAGRPQAKH